MEHKKLKLIKNKDGHGTINYKICLPKKWIDSMRIIDTIDLKFENNKIIMYKECNNMEKYFKTDKRTKRLKIKLEGNERFLPFDDLENYTETKIQNLGKANFINVIINGEITNNTIYSFEDNLYIVETIEHFNTELISATLLQLIEV